MPFRTSYWVPLGVIIVTSSVLYIRILILIFKKRNSQQYASFFYKMFFIAGIFDLLSVFWYVGAQWIYIDQIFGPQILLDISHDNIPCIFYYHVFYFLYAQSCDSFPTIVLFLATLTFPIIISIHFFFQENVEFRLSGLTVERWVSKESVRVRALFLCCYSQNKFIRVNTIHAVCTVSVFNIFSAICYIFVIRKLAKLNRERSRDLVSTSNRKWRREISLTIVGFSTFLALCVVTCYFSINQYAAVTDNAALIASNRNLQIIYYLAMAYVNPWMLLITNGSMRKNIFRNHSIVDMPSVRTGATLPSSSSRQLTIR